VPSATYKSALVVTALFFMWRFLTCLKDILIPHLKPIFDLMFRQQPLLRHHTSRVSLTCLFHPRKILRQ
jgi:fucose permease